MKSFKESFGPLLLEAFQEGLNNIFDKWTDELDDLDEYYWVRNKCKNNCNICSGEQRPRYWNKCWRCDKHHSVSYELEFKGEMKPLCDGCFQEFKDSH